MKTKNYMYKYIDVIKCFLDGKMSPSEFCNIYTLIYLRCNDRLADHEYDILNNIFNIAEEFYDDPELIDDGDSDVETLIEACKRSLCILNTDS